MTRLSRSRRAPVELALLLAAALVGCPALQKSESVIELSAEEHFLGQVDRVAFDRSGNAWMATRETLYRVQDGKPQPFDSAPGKYDQLVLAPDGSMYARLLAGGKVPGGLFIVELMEISDETSAGTRGPRLELPDAPYGFAALYLGGIGRLIATVTPLDDPEGLGGDFLYTFWSRQGLMTSQVTLEGARVGIVDVTGDALLLLGDKEAIAYGKDGGELLRVPGSFRNGVLAADGTVALLNPNDAIGDVVVARKDSREVTIHMKSPVYELALTADGAVAAVAVDEGQLFFVSPGSCKPTSCDARAAKPLPIDGTFLITAMRFVNSTTLAVGVIRRVREASRFTYPSGAAIAVTTSDDVLLNTEVALAQPATWAPSIDATYGVPTFAARTPHRVLLLTPGR